MKTHVNCIESVQPLTGMKLQVHYRHGASVIVDCAELPKRFAVFSRLIEPAFFRQVAVTDWGHSLEWPNGEGLDADRVMEMALEQAGREDTLTFRHWQQRNALSLSEAAAAIGMTRRTVSQYRTGSRPVPRTVLLALKGWETEAAERAGRDVKNSDLALGAS